jgi:arsenite-transporting ATPase
LTATRAAAAGGPGPRADERHPRSGRRARGRADGRRGEGGYRFFGGKGGVGKTTIAAAAALDAAETGRRILVVSMDPAHSLGDALAVPLESRATRVATRRGALYAAELDADRALGRWLRERTPALRAIVARGTYLDDDDIARFLALSLPGVDELIGLLELTRLARAGDYQGVIVDTAPTGHTLRLLGMPAALRRIASVLDTMHVKHRFLAERLGGLYHPDASDALIEEIDGEGRRLHDLLRDRARCTFGWVLLPETLAVEETKDGLRELEAAGLAVDEILVNRLTPRGGAGCRRCAVRRHEERAAITAVRRAFPGQRLRLIPALPEEPRGVAGLRRVARCLRAGAARGAPLAPESRADRTRPAGAAERRGRRAADWLPLVAPPGIRLLLFAGKGGVGKTTCAAAAALTLAESAPARTVLVVSTDPAHSLGDVLGVTLGDVASDVPGASRGLRARELDADAAFSTRRERYRAAVDEMFDALRGGSRFDATFDRAVVRDLLDLTPAGLDELFAMLSITEVLFPPPGAAPADDVVVVDAAPTGHTLRLLALPGTALEWIRVLLSVLLKYRQVIGLGPLAQDLVLASRGLRRLHALLRDRRQAHVVVVTRAAALPRLETVRLLDGLTRLEIAVSAIVVNAVTPDGCARCRGAAATEAREVERMRAAWAARSGDGGAVLLAPAVAPPPRGVTGLRAWARTWGRPDP